MTSSIDSNLNFKFELPTKIIFGCGAIEQLGEEILSLGGRRILLVCDPGIIRAGLTDKVAPILLQAGVRVEVFSAISANPRDTECLAGLETARCFDADVLIGLGGGSAMDAAKAIGVLLANGGIPQDWADGRRPILNPPPPLICIPTTAGTGSEITPVAVITDATRKVKMGLQGARVAPAIALLDPDLTQGLPPDLTAATGMDALTHAIEAYTCRRSNPVSDALALAAIEHIGIHLPDAFRNGGDGSAREHMLLGSLLAGAAFGQADVAAVHCMAESLGGLYDTPHGIANAVFLPHVMGYNLPEDPARYARIGKTLRPDMKKTADAEAAASGLRAVVRMCEFLGIPRLQQVVRLTEKEISRLAAMAFEHPCTPSNLRPIDADGYRRLFSKAYFNCDPLQP